MIDIIYAITDIELRAPALSPSDGYIELIA